MLRAGARRRGRRGGAPVVEPLHLVLAEHATIHTGDIPEKATVFCDMSTVLKLLIVFVP